MYAIEYVNAEKKYHTPRGTIHALKPLTLSIRAGEFFGLLGPNGAGKTTAINLLCGVNRLDGGVVRILGHDVSAEPNTCKRLVGVVQQELLADSFFPLDVMLNLQSKLSGVVPDKDWLDFLLVRLALKDHVGKTTRELSGGMKRRMMIARALAHKPKVVVLDEPTAGVDVELRHSMWEFIGSLHRLGMTIVLTTHYLEEAEEFCDRLAIIKKGELLTVKSNRELLELGGKPRIVFVLGPKGDVTPAWRASLADTFEKEGFAVDAADGADDASGKPQPPLTISATFDSKAPHTIAGPCARVGALSSALPFSVIETRLSQPNLEDVFLELTR